MPIPPAVLTVNQVANGAYDGTFVQVDAYLRSISGAQDGSLTLGMDSGTQSFRVLLPPGRSRSSLRHLALESRLRLKGIAVVNRRFNKDADPFVILAEPRKILKWWRGRPGGVLPT